MSSNHHPNSTELNDENRPFDNNRKALSSKRIFDLASSIVQEAQERNLMIGTAESCTAGLIAAKIADIPGASNVLAGGVVSYSNEVKQKVLGVSLDTLKRVGAVSEETALQMAQGCKSLTGCDIAVSVTGIAGPGGAVPGKPVGTVWIGIASKTASYSRLFHFEGDREEVRLQTVCKALEMLLDAIREK